MDRDTALTNAVTMSGARCLRPTSEPGERQFAASSVCASRSYAAAAVGPDPAGGSTPHGGTQTFPQAVSDAQIQPGGQSLSFEQVEVLSQNVLLPQNGPPVSMSVKQKHPKPLKLASLGLQVEKPTSMLPPEVHVPAGLGAGLEAAATLTRLSTVGATHTAPPATTPAWMSLRLVIRRPGSFAFEASSSMIPSVSARTVR